MLGALLGVLLLPALALAGSYTVQPGDTLSSIAQRLGLRESVLLALNPEITSPDQVYEGQRLVVPDNALPIDTTAPPATAPTAPTAPTASDRHTIQPGETLTGIARHYGLTLANLLAANPGLNPDLLFSGTTILIPAAGGATAPTPPDPQPPDPEPPASRQPLQRVPYVVQPGDTYSGIAAHFGISTAQLLAMNPSTPPNRLRSGGVIIVPATSSTAPSTTPTTTSGSYVEYVVVAGDTASGIAAAFGLSLAQLQAANPDADLSVVRLGQRLHVPTSAGESAPSPSSPASTETTIYVVREGDTATDIADAYHITLDQLAALNPSLDLNLLLIAQALIVPKIDLPPPPPGSAPAQPAGASRYVVQLGDTASAIAAAAGISVQTLLTLNPGLSPDLLSVDQELLLPGTQALPTASTIVTLDAGDTIEYVAARLGVLPDTLLANNPSLDPNAWIPAGTTLVIPDREGLLITVQESDSLAALADRYGSSVAAVLADPGNGVTDPNGLIIGQQVILPILVPAFIWPVAGPVTDSFGVCRVDDCSYRHRGVDIAQWETPGVAVLAAADGVVTALGGSICCGLGINVQIDHGNGWVTLYAHLDPNLPVFQGQAVRQGEIIGYSGCTGFCTGVHLHFEIHHNGWYLDARNYLPGF